LGNPFFERLRFLFFLVFSELEELLGTARINDIGENDIGEGQELAFEGLACMPFSTLGRDDF
jgi:hypothetical protein